MKFQSISSIFMGKDKKESYDTANKIQNLASKLLGLPPQQEIEKGELNAILTKTYDMLEKLDVKLKEDSRKKSREYGKGSGFISAQISLGGGGKSVAESFDKPSVEQLIGDKAEIMWDLSNKLIDLRDRVILIKEEFINYKIDNILLLYDELGKLLETQGVTTVELSGKFSPENQRIVATKTTNQEELDNTIISTVRPGYAFRGKQVRPQEVIVYMYKKAEAES